MNGHDSISTSGVGVGVAVLPHKFRTKRCVPRRICLSDDTQELDRGSMKFEGKILKVRRLI